MQARQVAPPLLRGAGPTLKAHCLPGLDSVRTCYGCLILVDLKVDPGQSNMDFVRVYPQKGTALETAHLATVHATGRKTAG
jgi:hypothetical protein